MNLYKVADTMIKHHAAGKFIILTMLLFVASVVCAEQAGSIRGMVYDSDFDVPLAAGKVLIAETSETAATTDEGNYVFGQVEPGAYTLVFSKDGYTRQVKADVVVSPGQMTEVNASLSGEFEEMEEFVVQDVQIGTGTEAALLDLRMESPALLDSISADLMSQAGASDAASALKLISGTTVQDGKYATIRGLPDRYVNSQMNGVRLPTADADKRAVQLDQFPSAVIESIQVSKTFTPDQQGDASGGAVNVVLKGIPEETTFKISGETSWNTNVEDAGSDFLSYKGGGVSTWGRDDGRRDPQLDKLGQGWAGAAGVSSDDPHTDFKWSISGGGKIDFDDFRIGGFGSFFYERDSSYFDDGINEKYWVEDFGDPMTPQVADQGTEPKTQLFSVEQGSQNVQWGGMGVLGFETENHLLRYTYMYTRDTEDKATLLEDTKGKYYFFPGYDVDDPADPGNNQDGRDEYAFLRTQTLEYTERTTETKQLYGKHTLGDLNFGIDGFFMLLSPELDWTLSENSATLYQPDKRQFGSLWRAAGQHSAFPIFTYQEGFYPYKPAMNANLGNFQRIWKDISEDSEQYSVNFKLPFEQWSGDEGYLKFGIFDDKVERSYDQDSYLSIGDDWLDHDWEEFWSDVFPDEDNPVTASEFDVDYEAEQKISAWYYMLDVPLWSQFNVIGGVRYEDTELEIKNFPDLNDSGQPTATWLEPGSSGPPIQVVPGAVYPAGPDVSFEQSDILPSLGFEYRPLDEITMRGSYSETVARQTFKELSPIMQMEYLGADVFIGNPGLKMSALKNYDLRFDWTPYDGGLFSVSYFYKDVTDPIEYVQANAGFTYTYPVNYPEGELSGYEFEVRQKMGQLWEDLEGLSLGANLTLIDSEVTLSQDEATQLAGLGFPEPKRDMTNAPEHLYNLYMTYELARTGTQFGLFYTVRGDTLIAGAGQANGNYVPSVYETEFGTLNFSLSQDVGEIWKLKFQAKNLLDPKIETVYRSDYIGDDVTKTSYRKGMDFSISLSAAF